MKNNFLYVYISYFPFSYEGDIFPHERKQEILDCSNEKTRQEKTYDWKLLETLVKEKLSLNMKDVHFYKEGTKWKAKEFYFSMSHSGSLVMVGISNSPIGVDIQKFDTSINVTALSNKVLSKDEKRNLYPVTASKLIKVWAEKEAIFKKGNEALFNPLNIDLSINHFSNHVKHENIKYYYSIANDDISELEIQTELM